MPRQKDKGTRELYCFNCFKWVAGRHLSGGYYCPHCSAYLQIKNQPRPWKPTSTPATETPAETPPKRSTSGGSSGAKATGSHGS